MAATVGSHRGTPDISVNAAADGGAWVYCSFVNPGWHMFGGKSKPSPTFSRIVAPADQLGHHGVGAINLGLYLGGALSQHTRVPTGLVDVTIGAFRTGRHEAFASAVARWAVASVASWFRGKRYAGPLTLGRRRGGPGPI